MSVIVEIRAAEGGDDAKALVREQLAVYVAYCGRHGVPVALLDIRPAQVTFQAGGPTAAVLFDGEAGGHRWQRIPPNEKRGRVHTSTVTVAVLPVPETRATRLADGDIEWRASRGSGAGGQHRNKTDSAIDMTHRPTGLTVHVETDRSQTRNRQLARDLLDARVAALAADQAAAALSADRRRQVGSGMRGDKIRTLRAQDGIVTDHRTGKRARLADYLKGHVDAVK